MNENLRVRIHIVGVVVTALFCSLFARLWFLQVNESPTELNIASESLRTIRTASTRGLIFDSRGRVLVGNRISWSILADPSLRMVKGDSPSHKAEVQQHRAEVVPKLSALLAVDRGVLEKRLNNELLGPLEPVVIWADLAADKRTQLAEHADQYPRVSLAPLALRYYAYPSTAPQTL